MPVPESVWRTSLAMGMLVVGIGFVLTGVLWHVEPVLVELEIRERPPSLPGMGEDRPPSMFGGPALDVPDEEVVRRETVTLFKPEPEMMVEVTRGGLAHSGDGRLRQTYVGAPPARCPT